MYSRTIQSLYIYIYIYMYIYVYIYTDIFTFFSTVVYYRILNVVPCAIQ